MLSTCAPRACRSVAALLVLVPVMRAEAGEAFAFRPGHVYVPTGGGIREYTASLGHVATLPVPGVDLASGCAFNPAGNLVMIGRRPTGAHLLEVTAAGEVVRQHQLESGFLGGSYLAVDAAGRYVVAYDTTVRIFSPALEPLSTLPWTFHRASGVAIGPGGDIFATDGIDDLRVRFGADGSLLGFRVTANTPTGMEFGPDGFIYQTVHDRVDRVDADTGLWTTLYSTAPDAPTDIEFRADGSYYLAIRANRIEHRSARHLLIDTVELGVFFDGVAVYVPTPSTVAVMGVPALVGVVRRRRREAPTTPALASPPPRRAGRCGPGTVPWWRSSGARAASR